MYLDEYKRWMAAELEDADLKPELAKIEGNDDEIKDRFAVALKFGTAGPFFVKNRVRVRTVWWRIRDSNPRPPACDAGALTS